MFLSCVATLPLAEAGQERQMNENTTMRNHMLVNSVKLQYKLYQGILYSQDVIYFCASVNAISFTSIRKAQPSLYKFLHNSYTLNSTK